MTAFTFAGSRRPGSARSRLAVSATALATALAATLVAGQAARAEVTAQQVWDDWNDSLAMYGEGAVTIGSEESGDGAVTVTDIAFTMTGEDGTVITGTLPSLVLTENGDGTVDVAMSEDYPITISSPGDASTGQEPTDVALAIRQSGMTMTVSGDPGAMTYDLAAARYALELDAVTEGGVEMPAEAMLAFNDVSGSYTTTTADMRTIEYDLGAASLDLLVDATNPDDGSTVSLSGKVADLATQASMAMPLDAVADPEMMMNGLALDGGYSYGGADYIFEVADATGPTSGTLSTGAGELAFSVSSDSVTYDSSVTGVAVEVASAMMPFPISATVAEYGISLLVPMSATDAPTDWAFGLNLTDLAVNEEIWAMLDPGAMLPHDPATAIIDLTGTATLFYDFMDPAQMEAMEAAAVPGEINSVSLNDLNLSIGGAQVTGTGAFTLDNTDMTTFAGIPRPEGAVDLQVDGLNGLIDTLVSMGLLPQEQVMGARMMLGLLFVPAGDDQLTSRIEVTADGQLLANGQRLQ